MSELNDYEVVIGLEVHCQLLTKTKLFCGCATTFGSPPNSQTCPVCLGLPGALPSLNKEAVKCAIKLSKALKCDLQEISIFDRKQYFYQDLPKGYQISQFDFPISLGGGIEIAPGRFIRLKRIHIEEDAGKSFHRRLDTAIDLNRAGVPLVEIVTEPDLRSAAEATSFFKMLQEIVMYIGVSDGVMEQGSLRCDANVSIRKKGSQTLGTRCEIKNLNSFRFLELAIEYEAKRQKKEIESGNKIIQQTRLYDELLNKTICMRVKEDSEDYRYFPDPDLLPLRLERQWVQTSIGSVSELPDEKRKRFLSYHIAHSEVETIIGDINLCRYFEETLEEAASYPEVDPKQISQWLLREVIAAQGHLRETGLDYKIKPAYLVKLVSMVSREVITVRVAQAVFKEMVHLSKDPQEIVSSQGLEQISDDAEIVSTVQEIISQNPKQLAEYLEGKEKVFAYFIGQVMRVSKGKYSPNKVNAIVKSQLDQKRS